MPRGKRDTPESPLDRLMDSLFDLETRIRSSGSSTGESILEMYDNFVRRSEHGRQCQYARKCANLFMKADYQEIRILLEKSLEYMKEVDKG